MEWIKLKNIAFSRRIDVLEMVAGSGSGHIGGSMSCMDILVSLYYAVMDVEKIITKSPARDRFILSKGHCAEALYAVLADKGFFPKEDLKTFGAFDTALAEHPTRKVPGVEIATGALGHGLSLGVGMALGLATGGVGNVYVLMGDGELAEGSVWEAAMAASKYGLGNLTAIVDRNRLQISGGTEDVMPLEDLYAKFTSFGWNVRTCDGHNAEEIVEGLTVRRAPDMPLVLIAETIKGYGSPLMEGVAEWHHMIPSVEQYEEIKADLHRILSQNAPESKQTGDFEQALGTRRGSFG